MQEWSFRIAPQELLNHGVWVQFKRFGFFNGKALALKDQGHAVGNHKGRFQIVSDGDAGNAHLEFQVKDDATDDICHDWVKARGGFVEQQDLGFQRDGPRKAHAALHATGKL